MKESDCSQSKEIPVIADYDSDETVVSDSNPGSEEEGDELYLKRMLMNGDVSPTSAGILCPNKITFGERSPEIRFISKLFASKRTESMDTATKQVSDALSQEEASQSLLRNWKRNSESRVVPLKENAPCQLPADQTGLCEDSQQLFDSSELEMQEDNRAEESQKASLLSAITAIDESCPEKETAVLDDIETVDVQNEGYNVSKTSKDGGTGVVSEETQPRCFTDEMIIDELLKISSESESLTQLSDIIDELSLLEMPEDGSDELHSMVLAEINSMQNPPIQPTRNGHDEEGGRPKKRANSQLCSDLTHIPGHKSAKYRRQEYGLQRTDKETLEDTCVAEESAPSQPVRSISSVSDHLFNVKEQSVTQNTLLDSNEKSTLTTGACKNVRCYDPSLSQTSPSLHGEVKSASGASKSATFNNAAIYNIKDKEQPPVETIDQQVMKSVTIDCLPLMSRKTFEMKQKHVEPSKSSKKKETQDKNTRSKKTETKRGLNKRTCTFCDCRKLSPRAKSSTGLIDRSKRVSHLKRKSNTDQPQDHEKDHKSTETAKATEVVPRKSARLDIPRNSGSHSERENGTDPPSRIDGREGSSDRTHPILFESAQLDKTESVPHFTSSKIFRNMHKRDFMGETLLHKACKKGDLEKVNALIQAGLNVNEKDNAGWTPIHEASVRGNSEIILALIKAGADVNCKALDGILPLHDAVYGNHFKAVEILLGFGANPHEKDNNMRNAFDKCCSDKMAEILASHCGPIDSSTEYVTANKEPHLQFKPNLASGTDVCQTGDSCSVEILDTLHDIESKQNKLLSTELEASEDAEKCVEELNEIQNVLNKVVNLQNMERDTLAKKYRASTDSFKQGILRDKIAKLASNQKTLLQVVRNQKEVTLKVIAHQQTRRSDANNGETSSELHYRDPSPGRNQISALCAVNEWLGASTANGSTMTAKIPAVDRVPDTESNPSQRIISKCISSSEMSKTAEVPAVSLLSVGTAERNSNLSSKQKPVGTENGPLNFDSCPSISTRPLQSTAPGRKSHHSFPVSITLDIMEKSNISVEKISQTPIDRHQTADTDQQLPRSNNEKAIQQTGSPVLADVSEYWRPQHKAIGQTINILNHSVLRNNVGAPEPEKQQKCVEMEKKTRTFPLRKLMKLGKLKPGVDVLGFHLQDYSHKATLLCDGQVTDCSGAVYRDPVQWVKGLLGNNISVTWKYVADKVTYIGKKLSSFIGQEDFAKPIGECEPEGRIAVSTSPQPPGHTVLQVKEILLVDKSEFFPRDIMDKYWEEFMNSDIQDF